MFFPQMFHISRTRHSPAIRGNVTVYLRQKHHKFNSTTKSTITYVIEFDTNEGKKSFSVWLML